MSERNFVEKPFLDQLETLGWRVIDQGVSIPTDPSISLRTSFKEVILKDEFKKSLNKINLTEKHQNWLTNKQMDDLLDDILNQPFKSLAESNENVLKMLFRTQVDANEMTGEQYPNVKLIDFENPENNSFIAINQFRIDTVGTAKAYIIPDIVLFVNGLPLVVVECKDSNEFTANPMHEAFQQLMRYSDQREETKQGGLKEGEPRLFYTNQILIRTCGDQADFGTITATDEEYFYPWKDIYPEKYRRFEAPLGKPREQEILIQGMLPKATLLDLVRCCTIFMASGKTRAKVMARYQQYRAVLKIIDRLRKGDSPKARSGVIWHTQGSGKSLTMVFAIRKLRMCEDLKDHKICMINDRKDLEKQLGETAELTGEKITFITSSQELKAKLQGNASNLNMVMIHKFQENQNSNLPEYLIDSLGDMPVFKSMGLVNSSTRILLMIDEAHRTQSGDFGDNLFEAFPNATRLAFTGTPLIRVKDKKTTSEQFGDYIDKYKLQDAVNDKATVQILYEGKTADTAVKDKPKFDEKVNELAKVHVESQMRKSTNEDYVKKQAKLNNLSFDDLSRELTENEISALKKKWGTSGDIMESEKRIEAIAADIVRHYISNILPNGFKAQVVCSTKMAAVHYKKYLDKAIQDCLEEEQAKPVWSGNGEDRENYRNDELVRKIAFLKTAVVVSSEGTNERAAITDARKQGMEINAVENFKKKFDYDHPEKSNTGVAFLVVCDMLLTGFDAPIEQVMYIDKKIKDHNLLQTIARVNRVAKGKSVGYIIDYVGLTHHLKEAMSIYAADDAEDLKNSLQDIESEIPILESRFRRLVLQFKELGIADMEPWVKQEITNPSRAYEILERAIEVMEDLKQRSNFEVYLKKFLQSLDIVLPDSKAYPFKIPAKRFGYLLVKIKNRYKDDSLDISNAGEKVKQLINEHLISVGINSKIKPVELFSPRFITELEENKTSKAKASEMEHAIRKHCKVHLDEDPVLYERLSEKLESLIKQYRENWDELYKGLFELRKEAEAGRKEEKDPQAAPFMDLIAKLAFGKTDIPEQHSQTIKELVQKILGIFKESIGIINFWNNAPEVKKLKGELSDLLLFSEIDEILNQSDKITTELMALAKARHNEIMA